MTYNSDDIQQILQRAMNHPQNDSYASAQLAEMAEELGVSAQDLAAATTAWLTERDRRRRRQHVKTQQRRGFMAHLIPFMAVNTLLILVNLVTNPKHFWAIYPLSGWGLGLALHGLSVYRADDESVEPAVPGWLAAKPKCG